MTIHHDHLPAALLSRESWVGWRYETREGKKTKVPVNPHSGSRAKTNDASTWSDYETALAAVEKHGLEGVGHVFSAEDPHVGIDIDDCRDPDTGTIALWAQEIIDALPTYWELSPSGTGVKGWLAGTMKGTRHRWKLNGGEVEIYPQKRFFTFTGEHLAGSPLEIEARQNELEALTARLDEQLAATKAEAKATPADRAKKTAPASDEAVLKRLRPKEKCKRLLAGDYSDYDDDHSTADLVICGAIAREVGADPQRIDRIFRSTSLMRPKWDEVHRADGATYGQMVIEKALEDSGTPSKRGSQKETILAIADDLQLLHTPDNEAFAAVQVGDHVEILAVMGKAFGRQLRQQFWESEGKAPTATSMRDALLTLEARANFEGAERDIGVRVVEHENAVYLDLANERWEAVRITRTGWEVVANPLLFRRGTAMRSLPTPVPGGKLVDLLPFLNVEDEDAFILVLAWLVGALRPHGPYPVLVLSGEQGSAKSFTTRLLRSLIDPVAAPLKSVPTSDRELMIAATGSWLLAYDNLSGLSPAMSDALCRLATGGGLARRELYTNSEEVVFDATRAIAINGIDDLTGRADLLSRSLAVTLPTIPADKRRTEADLATEFERAHPCLLGALCDAVSAALRHVPDVRLENPPRMSDFATWVVAAEPALPWEAGRFLKAYARYRQAMDDLALDMDWVAVIIIEMMQHVGEWSGTATDLLNEVRGLPGEERRGRGIPQTPRGISNRLHRIAPLLRSNGIDVQFRKGTRRLIIIISNADGPRDRVAVEGARLRIRPPHGETK